MATITLDFLSYAQDGILREYKSVQVGDIAYYTPVTASGGFSTANQSDIVTIGTITSIGGSVDTTTDPATTYFRITCNIDDDTVPPTASDFIFFSKDNTVNMASLLGYYGSVKFKNNSTTKAEMFATSCEVVESSK